MKQRILIANDAAAMRKMPVRVLESERFDVVLAGTGREAAPTIAANRPDLDGWESFELLAAGHRISSATDLKHPLEGRSNGVRE